MRTPHPPPTRKKKKKKRKQIKKKSFLLYSEFVPNPHFTKILIVNLWNEKNNVKPQKSIDIEHPPSLLHFLHQSGQVSLSLSLSLSLSQTRKVNL